MYKQVLKTFASGVGSAAGWGLKKTFRREPQFNLSHYEKDWDQAGHKMHDAWTDLGVRIGVKDPLPSEVLTNSEESTQTVVEQSKNVVAVVTESVSAVAAVGERSLNAVGSAIADAGSVIADTAGDATNLVATAGNIVKAVGVTGVVKAGGVIKSGWAKSLSVKDRFIKLAKEKFENFKKVEQETRPPQEEVEEKTSTDGELAEDAPLKDQD